LHKLFQNKHCYGNDSGSQPVLVSLRGLGNISGFEDFSANDIFLFPFIPIFVGIEFYSQSGGKHGSSQVFGIISAFFFRFSASVMFRKISVVFIICGKRQSYG